MTDVTNHELRENTYAIILAAGASTRLGKPKQLLMYNDKPLIQNICESVKAVFQNRLRIVLGANIQQIDACLSSYNEAIVDNTEWQEGMASSIRAGIRSLPSTAQAAMIVLVDQALITQEHLSRLLFKYLQHPQCRIASEYNKGFGVPAIFPQDDFAKLMALTGDKGAKLLFGQDNRTLSVAMPEAAIDIDTEIDYENLLSRSAES